MISLLLCSRFSLKCSPAVVSINEKQNKYSPRIVFIIIVPLSHSSVWTWFLQLSPVAVNTQRVCLEPTPDSTAGLAYVTVGSADARSIFILYTCHIWIPKALSRTCGDHRTEGVICCNDCSSVDRQRCREFVCVFSHEKFNWLSQICTDMI